MLAAGPVLIIAGCLDARDVLRLSGCSTTTMQALTSNSLWQRLLARDFALAHNGGVPSHTTAPPRRRAAQENRFLSQPAHTVVDMTTINYKSIYIKQQHCQVYAALPRKLRWNDKLRISCDVAAYILPTISRALTLLLGLLFGLLYADDSSFHNFDWRVVPIAALIFCLVFSLTFAFFVVYAWFVGSGTSAKLWNYVNIQYPCILDMMRSYQLPQPTLFQTAQWLDLITPALPLPWMRRMLSGSQYLQELHLFTFVAAIISVFGMLFQTLLLLWKPQVSNGFPNNLGAYEGINGYMKLFVVFLLPIVMYSLCLSSVSPRASAAVHLLPNRRSQGLPRWWGMFFALPMCVYVCMQGACMYTWASGSIPCTEMMKEKSVIKPLESAHNTRHPLTPMLAELNETEPLPPLSGTREDAIDSNTHTQMNASELFSLPPFTIEDVTIEHLLLYAVRRCSRLVCHIVLALGLLIVWMAFAVVTRCRRVSTLPHAHIMPELDSAFMKYDSSMTLGLFLQGIGVRLWSFVLWVLERCWPLRPLNALHPSTIEYIVVLVIVTVGIVSMYARSANKPQFYRSMVRAYLLYVAIGVLVDGCLTLWDNDSVVRRYAWKVTHNATLAVFPMIIWGGIQLRVLLLQPRNGVNIKSLLVLGSSTSSMVFYSLQHEYGQDVESLGRMPRILAGIPLLVCSGFLWLYSIAAAISTIHASATAFPAPHPGEGNRVYIDGAEQVIATCELPVWYGRVPMRRNPLHRT
jgi:hypothetical protein